MPRIPICFFCHSGLSGIFQSKSKDHSGQVGMTKLQPHNHYALPNPSATCYLLPDFVNIFDVFSYREMSSSSCRYSVLLFALHGLHAFISPIYDQLNKDIDEHAEADIRIPRLFLLELIGSKITHHSMPGVLSLVYGLFS